MILYQDYFDENKMNQPYASGEEQLQEAFSLMDMLLESYLEQKGGMEKQAFSKGLVVTESEIQQYLETPPFLRKQDQLNPVLASQVRIAESHMEQRVEATGERISLPLEKLRQEFQPGRYQMLALLLALAVHKDLKYLRFFAFLQDDMSRKLPTVGLLNALYRQIDLKTAAEDSCFIENGLLDFYFLELESNRSKRNLEMVLVAKPFLVTYLSGQQEEALLELVTGVVSRSHQDKDMPVFLPEALSYLNASYEAAEQAGKGLWIFLEGKEGTGREILANQLAEQYGRKLYLLQMDRYLSLTAVQQRDCTECLFFLLHLHHDFLYIRNCSEQIGQDQISVQFLTLLKEELPDITVLLGTKEAFSMEIAGQSMQILNLKHTNERIRLQMWQYLLQEEGLAHDVSLEELADCYDIPYESIKQVVEQAKKEAVLRGDLIQKGDLRKFLYRLNKTNFGELATAIPAVYEWKDIQLEKSQIEILKLACNRYKIRNRTGENWGLFQKNAYGNGMSILLYGPPGTGKTMAAQILANEVGIELYRVDLSQIYSKYIGETEKNLSKIFDQAQDTNVILFFDEADALFAKRTEVSNSNDRYSNSETSYLLQRMEEYHGISILATNLYQNFDRAFVRRITYVVRFERPDERVRYQLWTTILPEEVPMDPDIDFKFLAHQFELTGSNIKAILFNASYMAAAQNENLGIKHIVFSIKYEQEKLGKMIDPAEFGKYAVYFVEG